MPQITFDKTEEKDFDELVQALKEMPEKEQEKLKQVLRGIVIGFKLSKQEDKPVA